MNEDDDALAEVTFWRREMASKLWIAMALHANYVASDDEKAADIRVNYIMPILAAFRDADAKDWCARCRYIDEADARAKAMALVGWK